MIHANAPLTPEGRRRLASLIVDDGWTVRRAAERFQVSPATASRWARRYRAGQPLTDRPSRPHRSPSRLSARRERRIVSLRFTRRWGPHRIGYHLGIPRSTVGRVLARYRMPLLHHLDQATALPVRKTAPVRYGKQIPGELVHVDIKKLGGSRTASAGACSAGRPGIATTRSKASATRSCITRSTTPPALPTPSSSGTNARRPPRRSGSEPGRSSPSTASPSRP